MVLHYAEIHATFVFFLKEEMFLNNEISPPSSLCKMSWLVDIQGRSKQSQKIETYIDFLRLVLLTTRFTDCFTKLTVSRFFSFSLSHLKRVVAMLLKKSSTSFGKKCALLQKVSTFIFRTVSQVLT